jgi:hypothetical protein
MMINELDIMLENVALSEKVEKLERELLLKSIELLSLKDDNFSHVDVNKIDLDAIEMIERIFKSMGDDGLKLVLLKFFPTPKEEIIKNYQSKLMSEVPGLMDYLNGSKKK